MSITIAFPLGYKPVLKHGDHDQSSHGSWATGTVSDLKSETIPTSELGRGKVSGEIISAKITVQNEGFNISQINEKYDDGVAVMNLSLKDSENRNIGRLSASNQFVSNKEYAKIGYVEVRTNYQRKGVATAMLNFARKNMIDGIEIRHDWNMLSPSGKAWADVTKHGDHDQSSHGSWASGNFNEIYDGEKAQNTYFDTYGIKTDGSKEPAGITRGEIAALNFYTGDGYKDINNSARFGVVHPEESVEAIIQDRISNLDTVIEKAPEFFGDKNLYRVFDKSIIDTLEVGDVLTDKGFMSTTRVDITREEGLDVLQNLQMIRTTDDTPSILLPSESKKGKGLAVDYLKNAVVDLFDNVSTANDEREILLPRNTSLKFMGYNTVSIGDGNPMKVAVFQRMDK